MVLVYELRSGGCGSTDGDGASHIQVIYYLIQQFLYAPKTELLQFLALHHIPNNKRITHFPCIVHLCAFGRFVRLIRIFSSILLKFRLMMRFMFLLLMSLFTGTALQAQADTTIYQTAAVQPRFPGCEQLDTTLQVKLECSQRNLLNFVYQNVRYPYAARQQNLQGTVVASFVVEPDGRVSQPGILKEIGGGTAEEVLRIIEGMNEIGIKWEPGRNAAGTAIRVRQTLPVRFELQELPPYVLIDRDTVFTEFTDTLSYLGGETALQSFLQKELMYPKRYVDSCLVGDMDVSLLVRPDQSLRVIDVSNYNDLNYHFLYEAIAVAHRSGQQWQAATYEGRTVPAAYTFRVYFESPDPDCEEVTVAYEYAEDLAAKGTQQANEGNMEEALRSLDRAVNMFPRNANFRYLRAQVHGANDDNEAACADYRTLLEVVEMGDVRALVRLMCGL